MPDEAPADPVSDITAGMIAYHLIFQGMIEAGFTEWQACVTLGTVMAAGGFNHRPD